MCLLAIASPPSRKKRQNKQIKTQKAIPTITYSHRPGLVIADLGYAQPLMLWRLTMKRTGHFNLGLERDPWNKSTAQNRAIQLSSSEIRRTIANLKTCENKCYCKSLSSGVVCYAAHTFCFLVGLRMSNKLELFNKQQSMIII